MENMMDSELTQLDKFAALVAVSTLVAVSIVTIGVAGDKLATLLEDGMADLSPVLQAIRDTLDVMGNVSNQVDELCRQQQGDI